MNLLNSFSVSLCAWIAILANGLVLFRFQPLKYALEIVLVSVLTASVSLIIQYLNMIAVITFLPPLIALLFFSLITGFSWLTSLTMVISGLTVSGLLEFGVTFVLSRYDIHLTLTKLANDYTVEAWYFVGLHFLISFYLYKKRLGFTSIRKHHRRKLNRRLLIFILFFSFCHSVAGLFIVFKETSILYMILFYVILFIAYLVFNYTRELKDDP